MRFLPGRQSLQTRALVASLALSGISVLILTVLFLLAQRSALKQQLELRASTLAEFVASRSQFAMLIGNQAELEAVAAAAVTSEDVLFVKLAAVGQATISSRRQGRPTRRFVEVTRPVLAPTIVIKISPALIRALAYRSSTSGLTRNSSDGSTHPSE